MRGNLFANFLKATRTIPFEMGMILIKLLIFDQIIRISIAPTFLWNRARMGIVFVLYLANFIESTGAGGSTMLINLLESVSTKPAIEVIIPFLTNEIINRVYAVSRKEVAERMLVNRFK